MSNIYLRLVLLCLATTCGPKDRLKETRQPDKTEINPTNSSNLKPQTLDQLELSWTHEDKQTKAFQLNKIKGAKEENDEILVVTVDDSSLTNSNGTFSYFVPTYIQNTIKPGDCFVMRAMLNDESKTLPSAPVCVPVK